MKAYYNENKFYNHLEEWIGAVLLAVMVVMLFVQVVMRYVFKASAAWISEYALYMFMYFVFLACSGAFLRNDHIQIVAVIEKLPGKIKEAAHLFLYIVNMLFSAVVGYYVFLRVLDQFKMKTVSITQFPMWLMSASLLLGMGASVIRCLMNIYFIIRYEFMNGKEGK
ncbi:TRAP transporter small permease [Clostridium sp. AM58-1XD]|uniref:TRAP transporter small permease n=1 Tax=Clostridium sp. AM58-1XD TaxID=2292307 RepID=UPI000E477501|nr:TRAP transporter small permease [Clostridium sp. AM58-1XD]RGZ01566.1 TRAP transporter small permease [Clostridium sp. AM58-1XD]